jgi:hypothetical protein
MAQKPTEFPNCYAAGEGDKGDGGELPASEAFATALWAENDILRKAFRITGFYW